MTVENIYEVQNSRRGLGVSVWFVASDLPEPGFAGLNLLAPELCAFIDTQLSGYIREIFAGRQPNYMEVIVKTGGMFGLRRTDIYAYDDGRCGPEQ